MLRDILASSRLKTKLKNKTKKAHCEPQIVGALCDRMNPS